MRRMHQPSSERWLREGLVTRSPLVAHAESSWGYRCPARALRREMRWSHHAALRLGRTH